ncbi:MAG UNVERIFIED_CONTAM: hypothetical protein LVT10_23465 [Anaerolineae bacterium]
MFNADYIATIQEKYANELLQKPNVIGIGMGMVKSATAETEELGIVVMLSAEQPHNLSDAERMPKRLEGVTVEVRVLGTFSIL